MTTGSKLSVLLAMAVLNGAAAGPSASPAVPRRSVRSCALSNQSRFDAACAPFDKAGIRVVTAFQSSAFGRDTLPQDIAVLDDGTVMVRTDRDGLYRIADRRVQKVWQPYLPCGLPTRSHFDFAGSFDDSLLLTVHHDGSEDTTAAVRASGSQVFALDFSYAAVAQDARGVVWLFKGGPSDRTIFAYVPRTRVLASAETPNDIFRMFRSPNGRVYATNAGGLYELDSRPTVRARLVGVPSVPGAVIQAVGRDGSLWSATSTEVIHVRRNGTSRAMLLVAPEQNVERTIPRLVSQPMSLEPMSLEMTPDGAVWTAGGKLVRIDSDERIDALTPPPWQTWSGVKFGGDSSAWMLARDDRNGEPLGIVNFVPAVSARSATAWPVGFLQPIPTPTPFFCPPPAPPPTPIPPLPPKVGAVDFVYVANAMSDDLWGYWADKHGRLTQVRGSPFPHGKPVHLTIDPAGRHLYAGTWYDGIFAYSIDARSGTLRLVPGSPFAAGIGPTTVRFDRGGRYAYGANLNGKSITGYAVDPKSGALRPLSWSPLALGRWPFELAMNPKRNLAYVVSEQDIETFALSDDGALQRVSTQPVPRRGGSVFLIDRRARWAYLSNQDPTTIALYGIDPHTGLLSAPTTPNAAAAADVRAAASDPLGRFLYLTGVPESGNGPSVLGYRIDPETGALRPLPASPYANAGLGNGITVTPDGAFLYVTNFASRSLTGSTIDRATGALWPIPGSPFEAGNTPDEIISCRRVGDRCAAP
ncbi:MAG TPA: beta-propeller fold lactonase family protein [Candidatus Cybelea sp.]|nr:beta-propeller fold lactonase family protein [Candidatus Cybelea sp.]